MNARIGLASCLILLACGSPLAAPAGAQVHTPNPGNLIADNGFRPGADGYSFPNYGAGVTNLTTAEMRELFGDVVCANKPGPGESQCALTPAAAEWMLARNRSMGGGHCYGFSVSSMRFYSGRSRSIEFGAETVPGLKLLGPPSADNPNPSGENVPLARDIAYSHVHQTLASVQSGSLDDATPTQIVDELVANFNAGNPEYYTVAILKRPDADHVDFWDGHAITPFAVENVGGGRHAILVYDNNFPGQTRAVFVDRTKNTWTYEGSPNPSTDPDTYEGDAKTTSLILMPMSPGLGLQPCSFCQRTAVTPKPTPPARTPGRPARPAPPRQSVQVAATAPRKRNADLLIKSRRGVVGKVRRKRGKRPKHVNRLRGAKVRRVLDQNAGRGSDLEPEYTLPAGDAYTISLDNTTAKARGEEGISIVGPRFQAAIDDIRQRPGQVTKVHVSADGRRLSLSSNKPMSAPEVRIGLEEDGADHSFTLQRESVLRAGRRLVFDLDAGSDELAINGPDGTYDLVMRYVDDTGEKVFAKENVSTAAHTDGGSGESTLSFGGFDGDAGDDVHLEGETGERRSFDSDVKPTADHDEVTEEVAE